MVNETDLELVDGRTVHFYDRGGNGMPVFWHHGTPNVGSPPEPLFSAADRLGIRWISYDRPSYGGSGSHAGRDIASAAADVAAIANVLKIDRFGVMGHSGGGPHALASACHFPDRVVAAVSISGLAPFAADGLRWYEGMAAAGSAELHAAVAGRAALEDLLSTSDFDPEQFIPADLAMLNGDWGWLNAVAGAAMAAGIEGMVDDDLAIVAPWGFEPAEITVPVLLLHGDSDRIVPSSHAGWLADRIAGAHLRVQPGEGHISVLSGAEEALEWLVART